jgi:hypothetical protein
MRIIKFLLGILLIPLLAGVAWQAFQYFRVDFDIRVIQWVLLGILLSYLSLVIFVRRYGLLNALGHELTHVTAGCLLLRLPVGISVQADQDSETRIPGSRGGCLIALAPYFPVFAVPLLAVRAFAPFPDGFARIAYIAVDILVGMTMGFAYFQVWSQFRARQSLPSAAARSKSDFDQAGCLFSLVTIALGNVLFLVLVAAALVGDFDLFVAFLQDAWAQSQDWYVLVYQRLGNLLDPLLGRFLS